MIKKGIHYILIALFCLSTLFSCEKNNDTNPPVNTGNEAELFYYSKRNGVNNIYKSDLNGNETPIIMDTTHHNWWVRVSPDKQTILWYKSPLNVPSNDEYNNYNEAELWIANFDGSNPHKVTDLATYNWSAQGVADWSPDGTELVMAVIDTSGFWHIYITNADGTNPQKISQRNSLFADPSWSPDGQKIVYTAYPVGFIGNPVNFFNLEIHTMDKDGSNETRITNDQLRDHDPYWSPDGNEIAFESQWNILNCLIGKWSIRKYNFNTQQTTDVLKDDEANGLPRWTKNSKKIYFSRTVCAEFTRLMRMDNKGNNIKIILESNTYPIYDCDVVQP